MTFDLLRSWPCFFEDTIRGPLEATVMTILSGANSTCIDNLERSRHLADIAFRARRDGIFVLSEGCG